MAFSPLVRVTLSDQMASQLREAIAKGSFAAGGALPSERDLAHQFGASRVAVREALVTLQSQGVIERTHGRAARVVAPLPASATPAAAVATAATTAVIRLPDATDDDHVRDVKQARQALEIEVVRLAAQSIDAADSARLRAALKANRDAISNDDDFLATDMALHSAIAAISGNALFVEMSRVMLGWLERLRIDAVQLEGSNLLSHREHARIVERIIAHDADGAAKAMLEHLSRSHQAYVRLHSARAAPSVEATPKAARATLGTSARQRRREA